MQYYNVNILLNIFAVNQKLHRDKKCVNHDHKITESQNTREKGEIYEFQSPLSSYKYIHDKSKTASIQFFRNFNIQYQIESRNPLSCFCLLYWKYSKENKVTTNFYPYHNCLCCSDAVMQGPLGVQTQDFQQTPLL